MQDEYEAGNRFGLYRVDDKSTPVILQMFLLCLVTRRSFIVLGNVFDMSILAKTLEIADDSDSRSNVLIRALCSSTLCLINSHPSYLKILVKYKDTRSSHAVYDPLRVNLFQQLCPCWLYKHNRACVLSLWLKNYELSSLRMRHREDNPHYIQVRNCGNACLLISSEPPAQRDWPIGTAIWQPNDFLIKLWFQARSMSVTMLALFSRPAFCIMKDLSILKIWTASDYLF